MKYPLIYALSTVGILKHYNQDYLIHEQRTDFVGPNGVGKSIIADLFQLIFINDKTLFMFGTEGYKEDARQINKLPHKCRDAYTFLTIEIEADKFICIGVCIPNTSNRPLKPFVITADPDPALPMKERAFGRDKLPVAAHFINGQGRFSLVEELSRRFRDEYGLFFEHYSTGDQKDEHYARLYDQHLLPVDLSIPSSRRSFAKIVQSFSRARGRGDRSEELKDFLFDGVEKELEQTFDNHKTEIERQLRDYEDLQLFIADLEAKQLRLDQLNTLEDLHQDARKTFLLGNCGFSLHASNRSKTTYENKIAEYRAAVEKSGRLAAQLPSLRRLVDGYRSLCEICENRLAAISDCQQTGEAIRALEKRILELTLDDLPLIMEEPSDQYSIEDYSDQDLLKRIRAFSPLYRKYNSIVGIREQIEEQKRTISTRKDLLKDEIAYHELIIELFKDPREDTLITQVLRSDQPISPAQEAILFHLLKTHWGKPEGHDLPYYAEGYDFFGTQRIGTPDQATGAFWLQLGDLYMLIPALQHEPVLGKPELRSQAAAGLAELHWDLLDKAKQEMRELENFEKGQPYNPAFAECLDGLDGRLYDYGLAIDMELTAQLILQLDGKTDSLQREKEVLHDLLGDRLKRAGIIAGTDLSALTEQQKTRLECWKPRAEYYGTRVIQDLATETGLRETSIPLLQEQTEDKKTVMDRAMVVYLADRTALETYYPELITETLPETKEEELRQLKTKFDGAKMHYQSVYVAACEQFRETASGANPEISAELKEDRYSFTLLERALLGNRVRFRDQIAEELRTANRTRHKLVASIHETMLKIFSKTKDKYDEYRRQVWDLNLFFKGTTISNKYIFQVEFRPNTEFPIEWINQLQSQSQHLYKPDELPIGQPVERFVEDFFRAAANYKKKVAFRDLLDPKSYFILDAGLMDEQGKEVPGSTGETYSAKVLLGIGRLSKVQSVNRPGIRFIILEETANLDKTNFNNFPAIADEFGYQILTMTPKPFGSDGTTGWYLHNLITGVDPAINDPVPVSYFKTNTGREDLLAYVKQMKG